jgi:ribosomal protein S27E
MESDHREGIKMTNTEKVSYIRGLAEGLELDEDKKEVKVINAIIDLLDDMALSMSELKDNVNDMADQLDAVDEDLGSVEDDIYGDGDDEEDSEGEDEDGEGECYYEVTCPKCNEKICLSEDIIAKGQISCPNCGESLEFDFGDEECGEDCECCKQEDDE